MKLLDFFFNKPLREADLEEEKEDGKPNQIGIVVEQVTNIVSEK